MHRPSPHHPIRTPTNPRHSPEGPAPSRRAFSLIELLVVIAIVLVLAASTVGAIVTIMRANAVGNAVNTLNAQANTARSIAQRDGVETLLIIAMVPKRLDPSDNNSEILPSAARTTLHIAQPILSTTAATLYAPIPDRATVELPAATRVLGPPLATVPAPSGRPALNANEWAAPFTTSIGQRVPPLVHAIRFNPDGSVNVQPGNIYFDLNPDDNNNPLAAIVAAPFITAVDERQMQSYGYALNTRTGRYEGPAGESPRDFVVNALSDPASNDFIEADIAVISFAPNTGLPTVRRNTETP